VGADRVFVAGRTVRFPGDSFRFDFTATETEAAGRIVALIVPPDFPVETTVWSTDAQTRGFEPTPRPAGFALNLTQQILSFVRGLTRDVGDAGSNMDGFAFAVADYTIAP
jgi:hypothetical protein